MAVQLDEQLTNNTTHLVFRQLYTFSSEIKIITSTYIAVRNVYTISHLKYIFILLKIALQTKARLCNVVLKMAVLLVL